MQSVDVPGEASERRRNWEVPQKAPVPGWDFCTFLPVSVPDVPNQCCRCFQGGSESSGCSVLITEEIGEPSGAPGVRASRDKGLLPSSSGMCTG